MNPIIKRVGSVFLELVQTVVLALALFVISYKFFFQPEKVIGTSMLPNLHNSDFTIAEKVSYRFGEPKRGDIVVIKAPVSESCSVDNCDYVKRIIGLPNETIMILDGAVYINSSKLEEKYLPLGTITNEGVFLLEKIPFTLGPDQFLVMGDNRLYSHDGRDFGPITKEAIVGRIVK